MNKKEQYKKYLGSTHWQKTKGKFFRNTWFRKCFICGVRFRLNLHHLTYERRGHEKPEDLIPLCQDCHYKTHDRKDYQESAQWASDHLRKPFKYKR